MLFLIYFLLILYLINDIIISGDIQKNPCMEYKCNSTCSSPGKTSGSLERAERSERAHAAFGAPVPVLPVRNNLRGSHFTTNASRFHFRKGLSSRCSWRCTAILFILLFVLLLAISSYMSGEFQLLTSQFYLSLHECTYVWSLVCLVPNIYIIFDRVMVARYT